MCEVAFALRCQVGGPGTTHKVRLGRSLAVAGCLTRPSPRSVEREDRHDNQQPDDARPNVLAVQRALARGGVTSVRKPSDQNDDHQDDGKREHHPDPDRQIDAHQDHLMLQQPFQNL